MCSRNGLRSGAPKKMATSADVSMTIRGALARNAVFAVAENFVFGTRVLVRQRIHSPEQILNLAAHDVAFAVPLQPLPAFFERFLNGFGERLAGFAGHLAGQSFGGFVLDAQGHGY